MLDPQDFSGAEGLALFAFCVDSLDNGNFDSSEVQF
jgi:hypothetical protein